MGQVYFGLRLQVDGTTNNYFSGQEKRKGLSKTLDTFVDSDVVAFLMPLCFSSLQARRFV